MNLTIAKHDDGSIEAVTTNDYGSKITILFGKEESEALAGFLDDVDEFDTIDYISPGMIFVYEGNEFLWGNDFGNIRLTVSINGMHHVVDLIKNK